MHPFLGAVAAPFGVQTSDTTTPTTVTTTTSATAYNNITPVQLVASTAYDAVWLTISNAAAIGATGARTSTVFEIMSGGAGSETTIIGPVACGYQIGQAAWTFPIFIPAGTRLSIRVRSARTSAALTWRYMIGYGVNRDSVGLPQRWIAYGLSDDASANAQGTLVDPGNAAWSAWSSLTTSTTYAHDLWLPIIDGGTQTTVTAVTARSRWAIASTTNAATMATNATVWHGPWTITGTSETMGDGLFGGSTNAPRRVGGFGGPNGIFYHPAAAGSAVSVSLRGSAAPSANSHGCSILAAL